MGSLIKATNETNYNSTSKTDTHVGYITGTKKIKYKLHNIMLSDNNVNYGTALKTLANAYGLNLDTLVVICMKYKFLDYIEASGTQYINLNVSTQSGYRSVGCVMPTNNVTDECCVVGCGSGNTFEIYFSSSQLKYYNKVTGTPTNAVINIKYYFNGSHTATSNYVLLFEYRKPSESGSHYPFKGRIYSYILLNASKQAVRLMVPCKRIVDNNVGMIDLINNVFYANAGTGTFTSGPEVIFPQKLMDFVNPYDMITYTENDGSTWIRLCHQNNPGVDTSTNMFTQADFSTANAVTKGVYKNDNAWFMGHICNNVSNKWEFMIKQKNTSSSQEYKYRWVQYSNPMTCSFDDVPNASVIHVSNGYTTSYYGGLYSKNSSTRLCVNNGNSTNWWGAIGAWSQHVGGIPAWIDVVTTGYVDLYLRIK